MANQKNKTLQPSLPSFWKFVWMLFMQPISLHFMLKDLGIDPDASGWKLLKKKNNKKNTQQYLIYHTTLLVLVMPIFVFLFALFLQSLGIDINWKKVAVGVTFGVAFGVAGGIAFGVAFGVAGGIALGVALGVAEGIALGGALGVAVGVTGGIAVGVAFFFGFFRIWSYLPELVLQSVSYFIRIPPTSLSSSPLFFHELSYLPYPFLGRMIEESAVNYPLLTRKALARCTITLGQKRIGERTLVRLQFKELQRYFQQQKFESLYELKGEWLPARSPDNPKTLRRISEIGRYLYAYQHAIQAQQQVQHLQKAFDQLKSLQNYFLAKKSDWSITASQPLKTWQQWIKAEIQQIEQQTTKEIPNPFYYGRPISPEYGTDLFRGRETIARHIEQLLADQQQSLSIALLAPRRCGKSSMLKMLPIMLPDAVFVFYDLQDNTVDSIEGFFRSLVKRTQEQAYQDRGIKIPDLPEGTAFEAGREWLELVDKQVNRTLLICIDEFERLPELLPEGRQKLLQLMSLFRATIQHRQHIRLLVSGAAPFDELEHIWNDNFINVQEIKLPHLDYQSSIGLIREPIKTFPKDAIPADLADAIYQRSNGQPFLLQAFAGLTIEHLNNNELKTANLDMLDEIEEKVMQRCSTYFRDVYGSAPESAKLALRQLSNGENCVLDRVGKRWLLRRLLITEQEELVIPIFGHWVREFAGDL